MLDYSELLLRELYDARHRIRALERYMVDNDLDPAPVGRVE
jgi:hypothetical protein